MNLILKFTNSPRRINYKSLIWITIPVSLSAFTHLWNPTGFPSMHVDEAHYMRRAMLVLHGLGPQESLTNGYPYPFDHPYFGQLFLAGGLRLVGYPESLNPSLTPANLEHSIQLLYLVPRALMGLLAVLDTFLIYKISELRYSRNTALFASVLFAVMPLTWMLRRIYLDTILSPFLLLSVLFALYCYTRVNSKISNNNKTIPLVLLSGAFLGIAIFTKIPAIAVVPLIAFLVYKSNKLRMLGLWFIPVALIPLIWIAYSITIGHFDLWLKDSIFQAHRTRVVLGSMAAIFQIDPILVILSAAGVILAALNRDFFILLWIGSFVIFFIVIGWVQYFHWIPVLPVLCISAARVIEFLSNKISRDGYSSIMTRSPVGRITAGSKVQKIIFRYAIVSGIGIFGLVSTTLLITSNVNSSFFDIYTAIVQHLQDLNDNGNFNINNTKVTLIGSHWWLWNSYWIPAYVFHKNIAIMDPHFDPFFKKPIESRRILFIADQAFKQHTLSRNPFILVSSISISHIERLKSLFNHTISIAYITDNLGPYDSTRYPYVSIPVMVLLENRDLGPIEIRAN